MAHTLTVLRDGRVLAAGGWSDSTSPAATTDVLEVYDPAADEWETLPATLAESRHDHVALLLRDCRVLLAGGKQAATGGAESSPRAAELVTVPSR
jgi:N-acetylneuraminic acid mutarotase